jgi:hypothetical protein
MLWDVDRDEFADVGDADELCRRLLEPSGGRGSSTRHAEAVDLLARVSGTGDLGTGFVALLLCTCRRWDRVTGRLIVGIETARLLSDRELDELAETFLTDEVEVVYPLAWVSPQWLETRLEDPASGRLYTVDEDTPARATRRIAPPLRRWAARRVLDVDGAERLDELVATSERLDPHGRAAVILGLLDAAAGLAVDERRRLVGIGLATGWRACGGQRSSFCATSTAGPWRCDAPGRTPTPPSARGGHASASRVRLSACCDGPPGSAEPGGRARAQTVHDRA